MDESKMDGQGNPLQPSTRGRRGHSRVRRGRGNMRSDFGSTPNLHGGHRNARDRSALPEDQSSNPQSDSSSIFSQILQEGGHVTYAKFKAMLPSGENVQRWVNSHSSNFVMFERDDGFVIRIAIKVPRAKLCNYYDNRTCHRKDCTYFHICTNFICHKCPSGNECNKSHDLSDEHNQRIRHDLGLSDLSEGQVSLIINQSSAHVCYDFNINKCSRADKCIRLHVCAEFVRKKICTIPGCSLDHNFKSAHSVRILKSFGHAKQFGNDEVICRSLIACVSRANTSHRSPMHRGAGRNRTRGRGAHGTHVKNDHKPPSLMDIDTGIRNTSKDNEPQSDDEDENDDDDELYLPSRSRSIDKQEGGGAKLSKLTLPSEESFSTAQWNAETIHVTPDIQLETGFKEDKQVRAAEASGGQPDDNITYPDFSLPRNPYQDDGRGHRRSPEATYATSFAEMSTRNRMPNPIERAISDEMAQFQINPEYAPKSSVYAQRNDPRNKTSYSRDIERALSDNMAQLQMNPKDVPISSAYAQRNDPRARASYSQDIDLGPRQQPAPVRPKSDFRYDPFKSDYLCEFLKARRCIKDSSCNDQHGSKPYQWIISAFGEWFNWDGVESYYRDPANPGKKFRLPPEIPGYGNLSVILKFDEKEFSIQVEDMKMQVKRISTRSKCEDVRNPYATIWRWYYLTEDGTFKEYDSENSILMEDAYCARKPSISYTIGQWQYSIDFNSFPLMQQNTHTGTARLVCRRPSKP